MALLDEKNTIGENPPEDKKLAEIINFGQKKLADYLKQNPGLEYTRVEEGFINPLVKKIIDKANKSLSTITDKNIFENKRNVANQRANALAESLANTAYEQTSLYGLIKRRNAANTELNDAGWYIQNYPQAVYNNPANNNPGRLEKSKQIYANAEKIMPAYNEAIQRELKKEAESLRAAITPIREQLNKDRDAYNVEQNKTKTSNVWTDASYGLPKTYGGLKEKYDNPKRQELDRRKIALNIAEKYLEQIGNASEISDEKLKAFMQGFSHADWVDFATLGMKSLSESMQLTSILKKASEGKTLSAEETLAVDLYDKFKAVASGKQAPWTYGAAQGVTQSLPFMIDIALTGGLRSGIIKGGTKVARIAHKAVVKSGVAIAGKTPKAVGQLIGGVSKVASNVATAAATPIGWQNTTNRELESYKIDRDAEGNPTVQRYENAPSTFGNTVLGIIQGAISVGIEQMSLPLSKLGANIIKKSPKNNTAKAFGALLGAKSVREGNTYIAQVAQNIRRRLNLGNFPEELGEESAEKMADIFLLPDSPERQEFIKEENRRREEMGAPPLSWKDEFSWDEFLSTAGSVGLMSFMFGAARIPDYFHNRAARKTMEEAGDRLPEETRKKIDEALYLDDPQQQANALQRAGLLFGKTPEEKKAVFEYIARRAEYDAAASFEEGARQEQAAQHTETVIKSVAHSSGTVITAADAQGNQYFVKDGDPNNPDGTIIVANAQTGESKQMSPQGLQFQEIPAEQYQRVLNEQYMQQFQPQEDTVESQAGPQVGQTLTLNGTAYTIQGKNENGDILLYFENEQGLPEAVTMPEEEFSAALASQPSLNSSSSLQSSGSHPPQGLNNPEASAPAAPSALNPLDPLTPLPPSTGSHSQESEINKIIAAAPKQKNGNVDFNTLINQDPAAFAVLWENRGSAENAKKQLQRVTQNIADDIRTKQKSLGSLTDFNKIAETEDIIKQLQTKKQRLDEVIAARYPEPPAAGSAVPQDHNAPQAPDISQPPQGLNNLETSAVNLDSKPHQTTQEIQPIGKSAFGNIYDQFKGKPKEAIQFLMQKKNGEAIEALQHPEIGGIDLVWGNEKYGLEKIIKKHPEIVEDLQNRIADTRVVSVTKDKIKLESDKDLFIVAQHVFGNEKHWLITGYEKKNGTVSANTLNNETEPESKRIDTATPQNNPDISLKTLPNSKTTNTTISKESGEGDTALSSDNVSEDKDRKNIPNPQTGASQETVITEATDKINADRDAHRPTFQQLVDDIAAGEQKPPQPQPSLNPLDPLNSLPDGAARYQTLEAVNTRFNEELGGVKSRTYKGILHLGKPQEILQAAGIKAGEMELASEVLEKHLKKHSLTTDDLLNLADAIQNPIMVYQWGTKSPAAIIITELTTAKGEKITVALRAENKGRKLDVTEVASIHGKAAERFLSEMENAKEGGLKDALRWVEKEKALDWLGLSTLSTNQGLNSTAKIIQNFQNPKLSGENSHISDKKFTPISRKEAEALINLLEKSGLAKEVVFGQEALQQVIEQWGNSQGLNTLKSSTLEAVNARFNEGLENPAGKTFNLGNPSNVVLSAGLPSKPYKLHGDKIIKKAKLHGYTPKDIKDLPKALANPIAVFKGENDIYNILTEIEINGKKVLVGVETQKENEIDFNFIETVFDKRQVSIIRWINQHKGTYYNKEKTLSYLSAPALNTGATNNTGSSESSPDYLRSSAPIADATYNQELDSATKIIQNFQNPKLSAENSQVLNALKSPAGEVYGAIKDGVVYLDDTKLNANTPFHEFGHLWNDFVKKNNPELWAKITALTKETPYFKDLPGNPAYANLKDDDARADEAFAQALGDEGERIFNDPNTPKSIKDRFKQLMKDFWEWLSRKLGIRDLSPEQISKLNFRQALRGAVADITSGKPITFKDVFDGVTKENATFAPSNQNLTIVQMLEGTTPIETPKHSFKNFDEARKWGFEHIIGTYRNSTTEEDVIVSKKAIKKYISASAVLKSVDKDAHLSTLKVLPQIIKTSLIKEIHLDKKDNPDIKEIQRFYGAINYEGEKYPVKITVKATKNEGNKAYSYEVLDIENPGINPGNLQSGQQNVSENLSEAFPHSDIFNSKDTNNFETTKTNSQNSSQSGEGARLQITPKQAVRAAVADLTRGKPIAFKKVFDAVINENENTTFARIMEQKRSYILELFDSVKDKTIEARPIPIGKLTKEGKKYLSDISGLDFRNFTDFILNTSDLRHIYNDHYGENEKDKGNNIPLTDEDIKRILDVIAMPDTVSFLGYDKKRDANKFEFLKENENGIYNLIEVYGEKGGRLTAKTFFNRKRVATNEVLKSQGLPPLYARNVSGASPSGKVPLLININVETVSHNKDTNNFETTKTNSQNTTFAPSSQNLTIAQMLEGTTPIETPKHGFRNIAEARAWAKANIIGAYRNANTGENISVSRKAIDKYLSESAVKKSIDLDTHLSALKKLPQLIENSVLAERHPDRSSDNHIKEIQRLYSAIDYEGKIFPVKITVKVTFNDGNKAYSYEVMEIESPTENLSGSSNQLALESSSQLSNNPDISTTARDLRTSENGLSVSENGATESTNKDTNNFETTKTNSQNTTFAPSNQNLTIAQMLEDTTPIETPKHSFKNFDEARQWAKENIVGTYKNDDTDEDINVSKSAIDKYMSASAVLKSINKDAHMSAIKVIPALLKTSLLKEANTDRADDYHIKEIQRFYGAINYEGKIHPVKITVKSTKNEGNKAYSYEVMDIESPIEQTLPGQSNSSGQRNASASKDRYTFPHLNISIGKDTNNFETTKENLQNPQKNNNFAENNNVHNDKGAETNSERPPLVGRPETRRGIYQTIEASNLAGSIDTVREIEEREELESRGINPDWNKVAFRRELEKQAEQNGVLLDKSYLDDKELKHDHQIAATTENDVYLNPDGKTLTKVNNLSQVKGTDHKRNLKAFIDRLEAHNVLFPEIAYDVRGFIKNKRGFISLAMEQPYVDAERNATQEEIDKYLSDRGFWLEGKTLKHWTNEKYIIEDARPANVLKGKDGRLYFIDTIPHSVEYISAEKAIENSGARLQITPKQKRQYTADKLKMTPEELASPEPPTTPAKKIQKRGTGLVEAIVDKYQRLYNTVKEIEKRTGKKVAAADNPYDRLTKLTSRAQAAIEDFSNKTFKPLLNQINDMAKHIPDVWTDEDYTKHEAIAKTSPFVQLFLADTGTRRIFDFYMMAKHAPYRNAYIEKKTNGEAQNGSGITNDEAAAVVDIFEKKFTAKEISDFWKAVEKTTDTSLNAWLDTGRITKETYDELKAELPYFVPLRNWDESETDQAIDAVYSGAGNGTYSAYKEARGRATIADSPLSYMANLAQSAIVFKEKNNAKQMLFDLAVKANKENPQNVEASMQKRISDWLSEDNLKKAKGKTREQILKEFGNELEPVAYIAPEYLKYLGNNINDNLVYSGKGYFIDHAINHHPEVPVSDYKNIQDILNSPDDVLLDNSKAQNALVFVKQYKNIGTVIVSVDKSDNGTLVFHKSFFNQRKNSYAKYKSVRANLSLVGGHSTISRAETSTPASALSGRNDDTKVKNISETAKTNAQNITPLLTPKKIYTIETLDAAGKVVASRETATDPRNDPAHPLAPNERVVTKSTGTKSAISPYLAKQHEIETWINGQKYIIEFADEQTAQEINESTDAVAEWLNKTHGIKIKGKKYGINIGKTTKTMSGLMTQKNPVFWTKNTVRDVQHAAFRLWIMHDSKMAGKFIQSLPRAAQVAFMVEFANKETGAHSSNPDTQKYIDYYEEYRKSGSRVGFMQMLDIDRIKKDIDNALKQHDGVNNRNFLKKTLRAINGLASVSEDISRFAAFIAARKSGKDVSEASNIAKEVTVNFNRSGKYSGIPGAFYAFFNATIQASANQVEMFRRHPVKAGVAAAIHAAVGYSMYMLASALLFDDDGDDDELRNLSSYRKYINLFLPVGNNGFAQFPLSQTWRPFYAIGVAAAQVQKEELSPQEAFSGVAEQFGNLSPVELSGNWEQLLPTAVTPLVETFITKRNYMGAPLVAYKYNDPDGKKYPYHLRGVRTDQLPVWQSAVDLFVFGDKSTGRKSYIDEETAILEELHGLDISPDQLRHLVISYTGGLGSAINDVVNLAYSILSGGGASPNKVPIVSSYYSEAKPGYYTDKYYRMKNYFDKFMESAKADLKTGRLLEYADSPNFWEQYIAALSMKANNISMNVARNDFGKIIEFWDTHEDKLQKLSTADMIGSKDKDAIRKEVERISKETVRAVEPIFKELGIAY